MQPLLEDIAEVRSGLTLRGLDASRRLSGGGAHYLRISDISESGEIEIASRHPIEATENALNRHLLNPGEIVMANRGNRMTAAIAKEDLFTIVSSQLFRIRPNPGVLPEYLQWFLNREKTQNLLRSAARGTQIPTITIASLKSIPVPLPSIEIQNQIVQLNELAVRERTIVERIDALRNRSLEATLNRIIETSC